MTKEERFIELVTGLEIKINDQIYPNSMFWFKGDECFFELSLENSGLSPKQAIIYWRFTNKNLDCKQGFFWCSYSNVWYIFETEFDMKYNETKDFIKNMMENYIKIKNVTPCGCGLNPKFSDEMEDNFKINNVTPDTCGEVPSDVPHPEVGDFFKIKNITLQDDSVFCQEMEDDFKFNTIHLTQLQETINLTHLKLINDL